MAKYQKTISDAIMMADALKIGHNTQKLVRIPLRILFSRSTTPIQSDPISWQGCWLFGVELTEELAGSTAVFKTGRIAGCTAA